MSTNHNLVVVSILNQLEQGTIFEAKDWPLHVTLVPKFNFTGDDINGLIKMLEEQVSQYKPLQIQVMDKAMFGPKSNIPVSKVDGGEELRKLHTHLVKILTQNYHTTFESPDYIGKGFSPHITDQKDGGLSKEQRIVLDSFSIIDRSPDGDHKKRRIISNIKLGN